MASEVKPNRSVDRVPWRPLTSGNVTAGTHQMTGAAAVRDERRDGKEVTGSVMGEGSPPLVVAAGTGALPSTSDQSAPEATGDVGVPWHASGSLRLRLLALDAAAVLLCWLLLGFELTAGPGVMDRSVPGLAACAVTLVTIVAIGLHRSRVCARGGEELLRLTLASLLGAGAFVGVQWRLGSIGPQVLVCLGVYLLVATGSRRQFGRWLRAQRSLGRYLRGVVLVGSNEDAAYLRTMLDSEPELGYRVTGVVGDSVGGSWLDLQSSSAITDVPAIAAATGASGILLVPYAMSSADTRSAIAVATASGLHVQVWPGFRGVGSRRLRAVPLSGEAFFYVEPLSFSKVELVAKRVMDIVGAVAGLVATAPLLVVSAVLIKLDSPGAPLHRGIRIGANGKPFVAYKLRSMRVDDGVAQVALASINERTDGPLFKASKDPRVTKIGHFLRATSIDELPQLWNVLTGAMSLVGPRPALPGEVDQFDEELLRRHSVRPGLTGLWQIEARRNPSFHAYRRLDLNYVDNWSLWLDLSILLATVPSVISQALRECRHPK